MKLSADDIFYLEFLAQHDRRLRRHVYWTVPAIPASLGICVLLWLVDWFLAVFVGVWLILPLAMFSHEAIKAIRSDDSVAAAILTGREPTVHATAVVVAVKGVDPYPVSVRIDHPQFGVNRYVHIRPDQFGDVAPRLGDTMDLYGFGRSANKPFEPVMLLVSPTGERSWRESDEATDSARYVPPPED